MTRNNVVKGIDRQARAVIPPRKMQSLGKIHTQNQLEEINDLKQGNIEEEPFEEKSSGYHRRYLVKSKIRRIKLLGTKLSARHFSSQVKEILVGVQFGINLQK